MREFATSLNALLEKTDDLQKDIAEAVKIQPSYFSDIKLGNRVPTPDMVDRIAEFFKKKTGKDHSSHLHEAAARDRGYKV